MTLRDIFKNFPSSEEDEVIPEASGRIKGKIYYINLDTTNGGYAFVSSPEVPFTRIFMHWQALEQNTKNFTELKIGTELEFKVIKHPELGYRAIKVKVIEWILTN